MSSSTTDSSLHQCEDELLHKFIQEHTSSVPYISQSFSWDCGLACAQMAVRASGVKNATFEDLRRMCPTHSVWSIDIAYLLQEIGLKATYFTIMKGVRPEYRKQEFYKKQLLEDTKRVNHLFDRADARGVHVVQRHVQLCEIRQAVQEPKLVILLMDKRLLRCKLCDTNRSATATTDTAIATATDTPGACAGAACAGAACAGAGRRTTGMSAGTISSGGFLGHYVVVYAYHEASDVFLIKDPAAVRDTCVVSSETLEEARMAFGTDQDVLFIEKEMRKKNVSENDSVVK